VKDPNEVVSARFTPGQAVEVKDAHGQWLSAVADSSIERGHRFFRVWVIVDGHRMPWPADSVRDGQRP